ncbi:hypothetical protein IX317_001483 [Fusobacterium sp. DD29]|nr:hypothetical protein [Fusobacterium sp. DD29]MBR8762047.1 hypothetical protein [Fusobacterium sp. DD25]MBR8768084.1 hypothetical protein [Fusobacterium sp. DD43]MBR8772123.1 hypothetical protein [Fusobacterium sp. DD40]MBR8798622.1 hypothetical protein [Fusobacterium sp. DD12]MBR8805100.1 hypothetical protein [Fusobacterium sp. DD13]MBR8814476.1 hypothetical protein [Fusobacterium sp. DD6]MBR8816624.1 hypothetical protein [Fusobacterium sp. DD1]MBR8818826.1 hypothetical protein [Fusobact
MMYPRLKLARNLLTDDGVIFISIDDKELVNLKKICDEIFGEENLISNLTIETGEIFGTKASHVRKTFVKTKDYILVYSKNNSRSVERKPLYDKMNEMYDEHYKTIITEDLKTIAFAEYLRNIDWVKDLFKKFELKLKLKNISKLMKLDSKFKDFINFEISNILYTDQPYTTTLPDEYLKELDKIGIIRYNSLILFKTKTGSIRYYQSFSEALHQTDNYFSEYCRASARGDLWKGFHYDMRNIDDEGQLKFKNGKKPVRLLKQLMEWANYEKNIIVLDFFSGSATTAHAVMKLNAEDGGNRRYIMVQLPEPCDEKSEAYKEGYKNICEIGKERIRRAGEMIKDELQKENAQLKLGEESKKLPDIGFKVFKLDSSNIKEWDSEAEDLKQTLYASIENIKSDRTSLDILYEVLLKYGLDLNVPIVEHDHFYSIGGGTILINLDKEINMDVINSICEEYQNLLEIDEDFKTMVVLRDSAFENDEDKTNMMTRLEQIGIKEVRSI